MVAINAPAQTLVQTFEVGEDTSNWGADWVAPGQFDANAPGFMNTSVGGNQAAQASTEFGQEAHRDFRNNTAGVDVATAAYEISLLLQMDANPGGVPASGSFYVMDGTYGEYAAGIRLIYNAGIASALEAIDGTSWEALDVDLAVGVPYFFQFIVNPVAATYSATVSQLNGLGVVQSTATLTGLAITGNVFNNHNNGQLLFHVESSAGHVNYAVDNIRVSNIIPEPASAAMLALAGVIMLSSARRRHLSV